MGASASYTIFTGAAEMLGGILLTMRRTTLLGALVCIDVLGSSTNRDRRLERKTPNCGRRSNSARTAGDSKECQIPWLVDAAGDGFPPDPSQKLRADVFRHSFRASENVCHDGGLSGRFTSDDFSALLMHNRDATSTCRATRRLNNDRLRSLRLRCSYIGNLW